MNGACGSCGSNRGHIEGRCRNCGGPWSPDFGGHHARRRASIRYDEVLFRGMRVMVGVDDDGDLFVNINTEDGEDLVNNDEGDPQVYVYLNDATLYDPVEFRMEKARMEAESEDAKFLRKFGPDTGN